MLLLLLFSVSWLGGWGSSHITRADSIIPFDGDNLVINKGLTVTYDIISDTTDWKLAGTGVNVDRDGKEAWDVPTNIYACDGEPATAATPASDYTDWLRATNFGFATNDIPSSATIVGIEVKIRQKGDLANCIKDDALYLRKTSGQVGDNGAISDWWATSWEYKIRGGSSDDWNANLIPSDIHNSDFGVDLSVKNAYGDELDIRVDCIQIRIFYTHTVSYLVLLGDTLAGYGVVETLTFQSTIFDPDNIQSTQDAVPVLAVESIFYPNGIKVLGVGIKTNANSTYSVNFEEWTSPLDVSPSTILTIATSASAEADSIGPMVDSDIAVGSIIYVDLPNTDIDMLEIWGAFYIK